NDDDAEEGDVPPGRDVRPRVGGGVVDGEGDGERGEDRRRPPTIQYGGSSAHQGPSALKAFQNRVFAGCSSSDSSMSGTTSAWIVGVKRASSPCVASTVSARGNSSSFRKPSALSPMTTTSFGWTMCSSRTSHGRASSGS